jgi:hypothetical protein
VKVKVWRFGEAFHAVFHTVFHAVSFLVTITVQAAIKVLNFECGGHFARRPEADHAPEPEVVLALQREKCEERRMHI